MDSSIHLQLPDLLLQPDNDIEFPSLPDMVEQKEMSPDLITLDNPEDRFTNEVYLKCQAYKEKLENLANAYHQKITEDINDIMQEMSTFFSEYVQELSDKIKSENASGLNDEETNSDIRIVYNDNSSYPFDLDLFKQNPGTLLYQKYLNKDFNTEGNIVIDHDSSFHETLLTYLNNEEIDIKSMDEKTKDKFINDLQFFQCPIRADIIKELLNPDSTIQPPLESTFLKVNDIFYPDIDRYLKEKGYFNDLYNSINDTPIYDIDLNGCIKNLNLTYGDLINEFLANKQFNPEYLKNPKSNYADILQEFKTLRISLSKSDKNNLRKAWCSLPIRYIFINRSYHEKIIEEMINNGSFMTVFNNCKTKQYSGQTYCALIELKNIDFIENFIATKKMEFNTLDKDCKFCDLVKEIKMIIPSFTKKQEQELLKTWSQSRFILTTEGKYSKEFNDALIAKNKFATIFDSELDHYINTDSDPPFIYIQKPIKYFDVIVQYLATKQLDSNLMDQITGANLRSFTSEVITLYGFTEMQKAAKKYFNNKSNQQSTQNILKGSKLLKPQQLNSLNFKKAKLIYSASKNEGSAKAFHDQCNNKSKTLIVIKATDIHDNKYLFGGYTEASWNASKNANEKIDPKAFVFVFNKAGQAQICRDTSKKLTIVCNPNSGPIFKNTLSIPDHCLNVPIFCIMDNKQLSTSNGKKFISFFTDNPNDQFIKCIIEDYEVFEV